MKSDRTRKTRITLLTRLLHQHYARAIDAEIQAAGFDDIRPGSPGRGRVTSMAARCIQPSDRRPVRG